MCGKAMKKNLLNYIIKEIPKLANNRKHLIGTKINAELNSDETDSLIDVKMKMRSIVLTVVR